jgi:hypothetical protein
MEGNTLKEFLNGECQIFDFSFAELSMYVIIFNTNDEYVKKVIEHLQDREINLKITKQEENTYLFHNLSEVEDLDLQNNSNLNREKIYKICSQFLSSHVYLVNKGDKNFFFFDWNLVKSLLEKENDARVLGVFLNNKEKFLDFINEDSELTLINFKKEDVEDVSQLFEEEERKDNPEIQNEESLDQEEENFDREFDFEEEEEKVSSKKKKTKKHKKKKLDEYDMEYESKEEKVKRSKKEEVDESKFFKDVRIQIINPLFKT